MMKWFLFIPALVLSQVSVGSSVNAGEMSPAEQVKCAKQIDRYVDAYLDKSQISTSTAVSDEVFLRRVYLDVAGRIPSLEEYEAFMANNSSNKRYETIDELLDSPAYVSHTLNLWLDALRVKYAHRKFNSSGYKVWLREAIKNNMPYDEFVREQLAAEGNVYDPKTAAAGYFIRDRLMPEDRVATTMQLFLGTSMVCAQCHDHPEDVWTQMDFYKILAFFNGTEVANGGALGFPEAMKRAGVKNGKTKDGQKLNITRMEHHYKVLGDRVIRGGFGAVALPHDYKYEDGKPNQLIKAGVPFAPKVSVDYTKVVKNEDLTFVSNKAKKRIKKLSKSQPHLKDVNSRAAFADWVTSRRNPMFTKTIVNRLWDRVFGASLVGDLINISEYDMGKSPGLTKYLIQLMKDVDYDQKLFLRILYKSKAYQRVAFEMPGPGEMPLGAPVIQRLSAEQVWDSLLTIRKQNPDEGVADGSVSPMGLMYIEMTSRERDERFEFALDSRPLNQKADKRMARELYLGDEKKPSLNVRASLLRTPSGAGSFFGMFGQAPRELIDDRVKEPTIPQVLYLMNGVEIASLTSSDSKSFQLAAGYRKERGDVRSELLRRLEKATSRDSRKATNWIFNAVLTRQPTSTELNIVQSHLQGEKTAIQDLLWSLLNTNEFKMKR